jgi:hypothetical protein
MMLLNFTAPERSRKQRHLGAGLVCLGVAVAACVVGCAPPAPSYTGLDADRILKMAGDESGQIEAPSQRLTQQLNVANRQNISGHPEDARATLAAARKTLESAKPDDLTEQQRLAGWISLSELNRNANDVSAAGSALDVAIAQLNQLLPVQARCDYVQGVAREVNALRGKSESAKLLAAAGDWAVEIPDQSTRRSALTAFAIDLFRCDDYEGARKMLRTDHDAAWRSQTLVSLADQARNESLNRGSGDSMALGEASAGKGWAPPSQDTSLGRSTYGKPLDFRSNYYKAE